MTEIDRQIIMLFRQLTSDQKQAFLDFAKSLNLEVAPSGRQDCEDTLNKLCKEEGQLTTAAE